MPTPLDTGVNKEVQYAKRLHFNDSATAIAHEQRLGANFNETDAPVSLAFNVDRVSVSAKLSHGGDWVGKILSLALN